MYPVISVEPRNCTWKIIEINFSFNSEDVESYKETSSHPNNKKMMDKLQTNEDSWILRTAITRQKGNPYFRERQAPTWKNRIWLPGVCMRAQSLGYVQLFVTPWTITLQAPLSLGFPRQEYWSGLPFPPPGIFQTQGSNLHVLCLLHWQADLLPLSHPGSQMKCSTWMQSQKWQNDLCSFPRQTIQYHSNPSLCPNQ